jgi:hypothetical protein
LAALEARQDQIDSASGNQEERVAKLRILLEEALSSNASLKSSSQVCGHAYCSIVTGSAADVVVLDENVCLSQTLMYTPLPRHSPNSVQRLRLLDRLS